METLPDRSRPGNVSRLWHRRYLQPRDDAGRFSRGTTLYTRYDGQTRWLRHSFVPVEDDCLRALRLTDESRRVLTHLFVIAVAALLIGFFW